MKKKNIWMVAVVALLGAITVYSCSKKDSGTSTPTPTVADSTLINIGTNVIVPSYQAFNTLMVSFDAAVTAFNASPTTTTLAALQAAFKTAYKAYEVVSPFEFGPASDAGLTTAIVNVFPTDTTVIKSNISTGNYTVDAFGNLKAQGFPALDYLLFATDNNSALARFTTSTTATNAKKYLADLSTSLKTKAATVTTTWSATYLAKFIANTGVNAGSSLSLLVNAIVYNYDVVLKNYKLGIPIGKYGTTVLPQDATKVEGYYSGLSLQLLIANLQAIQNIYLGAAGLGLDDKVTASGVVKSGSPLNTVITAEITAVLTKVQAIQETLAASIKGNTTAVADAYAEVQKLVVLLKVDMSAALGVKISFQDDDGD